MHHWRARDTLTARVAIAFAVALIVVLRPGVSEAQVQRSGGSGGANAQLAQQYQQAVADRTKLQADNDKLKKDLEDTKKQLDSLKQQLTASKSAAGSSSSQLAAAQAAGAASAQSLEQTKTRLNELVTRFRDTAVTLRGAETERNQLQQQLAQSKASYDKCAERNYKLYQVSGEVLDRYEHQGVFSYMAQAEPFTRIKRTQIENFVDEYKERAEQLRIDKSAPPSSVAKDPNAPVQFTAAPPPPEAPATQRAPAGNDPPKK
jgi:chromosome segregation ATPase